LDLIVVFFRFCISTDREMERKIRTQEENIKHALRFTERDGKDVGAIQKTNELKDAVGQRRGGFRI